MGFGVSVNCSCGAEEQTVNHVPNRTPLVALDEITVDWLKTKALSTI